MGRDALYNRVDHLRFATFIQACAVPGDGRRYLDGLNVETAVEVLFIASQTGYCRSITEPLVGELEASTDPRDSVVAQEFRRRFAGDGVCNAPYCRQRPDRCFAKVLP